ncbi:hypothetical protein F4775DRAFT_599884 [Biscogniauxia sp. FL1348]|nr:hypothetical protein F4775DRAFT_599884 [Biscogniauxia sp. FL1348]
MGVTFDVSPEKYATSSHWYIRQLFETPPATLSKDADLSNKTAIVTGANQGLGLEIARQLLDLGLRKLIIAVRDETKGQAAAMELSRGRNLPKEAIEVWKLDMLDYGSITSFAQRAGQLEKLNIVVLNAGILRRTMNINPSTGHEEDIQTNYLSTMLLLLLLLSTMKSKNPAPSLGKITIVTSDTACMTKFEERNADPLLPAFDNGAGEWDAHERYATSKLLGQLFLAELVKRVPPSIAVVNAASPGLCRSSGLARDTEGTMQRYSQTLFFWLLGRAPHVGARVVVDAAVRQGEDSHGQIVDGGKLRPMPPLVYTSEGEKVAQRLWSETMRELSFAGVRDIVEGLGSK